MLRVILISDVPVELRSAGSTLLFRLFQQYPPEHLVVVQSSEADQERSLPGVRYLVHTLRLAKRLQRTRFHSLGSQLEFLDSLRTDKDLDDLIRSFKPHAIVSVTFRFAWIRAYKASLKHSVPLHLILHDDILTGEDHGRILRPMISILLDKAYSHASTRACISPNMEEYYFSRFGVRGSVLYPTYSPGQQIHEVIRMSRKRQGLTFCYAGSLYTSDFLPMLDVLASELGKRSGKLVIFSNISKADIAGHKNLHSENVEIKDLVHPEVLRRFMQDEVDVNILLNSFAHEVAFRYNFSSKLVDYSLSGKPVFIWGNESSGAIRWAQSIGYPCLTSREESAVSPYLDLFQDAEKRYVLALALIDKARGTFDYKSNAEAFFASLKEAKP